MKIGIAKHKIDAAPKSVLVELRPFLLRETNRSYEFDLTLELINKYASIFIAPSTTTPAKLASAMSPVAPLAMPELLEVKRKWWKVSDTWRAAARFAKQAGNLGLSMASTAIGRADEKTRSLRVLSCHGIDASGNQVQPPCVHRAYSDEKRFHFCNACGCGEKEIARLSSEGSERDKPLFTENEWLKLDYLYLACPIGAAGFSNHD